MSLLKFYGTLFAASTFVFPVPLPAQTSPAPPGPAAAPFLASGNIIRLHDVVIGRGGNQALHAEIAYPGVPDAAGTLPAVIFIHGGGWIAGSYKDAPIVSLAQAGFFAASIEYRLDTVAKWPAQIDDCKLGVRWLRANAGLYHVDSKRIGVWGESAGGHLALCLGTMSGVKEYEGAGGYPGISSAVQAVVDFYGPSDFTGLWPDGHNGEGVRLSEGLFGVPHEQNPALWKSGSPLLYVKPGDPPMLLVQGDSDRLVRPPQSTRFDAALTKAGVPHELLIVKNAGHGFVPNPGTTIDPSRAQILENVFSFFSKYLGRPSVTGQSFPGSGAREVKNTPMISVQILIENNYTCR